MTECWGRLHARNHKIALCEKVPKLSIILPFPVESCHRGSLLSLCCRPGLFANISFSRPGKPGSGMNATLTVRPSRPKGETVSTPDATTRWLSSEGLSSNYVVHCEILLPGLGV